MEVHCKSTIVSSGMKQKNATNIRKHHVSFDDARAIWDDPMFMEVHLTSEPEDRWAVIGRVGKSVFLTAIITYRDDIIRIISVRKSTKKEIDVYEKH